MKRILFFLLFLPSLVFAQLELPYPIKVNNPKPLDYYYFESDGTPYESTSEVTTAIPSAIRYQGMTVNVVGVEYWFGDGTADEDLVVKSTINPDSIYTYQATLTTLMTPDGYTVPLQYNDWNKYGSVIKLKFDQPANDPIDPGGEIYLRFPNGAGASTVLIPRSVAEDVDPEKTYVLVKGSSDLNRSPQSLGTVQIGEIKEGDVITPNNLRFTDMFGGKWDILWTKDTTSITSFNGAWKFYDGRDNPTRKSDFSNYARLDVSNSWQNAQGFNERVTFNSDVEISLDLAQNDTAVHILVGSSSLPIADVPYALQWRSASTLLSSTPPGSDTQIILNDGGAYGADAGLRYDKATNLFEVTGQSIFTVDTGTGNAVTQVLALQHTTTDTPSAGIGAGMTFTAETSAGNNETGATIEAVTTDVTSTSEDFDLVFKTMSAGASAAEKFRISSFGGLGLGGANYGTSGQVLTSNGSSAAPTWQDASGSGGITNGAGVNELMKSDGTNATTSGLFVSTAGSIDLGTGLSGSSRSIVAAGSASDIGINITAKGAGTNVITAGLTNRLKGAAANELRIENTANTAVSDGAEIQHNLSSGTPTAGIGAALAFRTQTGASNFERGSAIASVSTDVTSTSEDFDLVFYNMAAGAAAAEVFRLASDGDATLVGTGTGVDWVATSDRRLKYNIRPVAQNQLAKISKIASLASNYDRKDTGKNEDGFIAQDLLKVAPQYVEVPSDTSAMMAVNYAKMVVPLYKGVDELNDEVTALKQEIEELKAIIRELQK